MFTIGPSPSLPNRFYGFTFFMSLCIDIWFLIFDCSVFCVFYQSAMELKCFIFISLNSVQHNEMVMAWIWFLSLAYSHSLTICLTLSLTLSHPLSLSRQARPVSKPTKTDEEEEKGGEEEEKDLSIPGSSYMKLLRLTHPSALPGTLRGPRVPSPKTPRRNPIVSRGKTEWSL